MKILGIETTTRIGTMAFVQDSQVLRQEKISENLRHAGSFEETLKLLLGRLDIGMDDLDAVAVGLGPGSFTGVRVGLIIAKGLVFGNGKKLLGVGTMDALVHQISFPQERICPIIAGEGSEVYGALFEKKGDSFRKVIPEFNVSVNELSRVLGEPSLFFGPGLEKHRKAVEEVFGVEWVHSETIFPDAASVAIVAQDLAWRLEGEQVVPRYVKHPPIKKL